MRLGKKSISAVLGGAALALSLGTAGMASAADTPTTAPTPANTRPVSPTDGQTISPNFGIPPTPCPTATIRTFAPTTGPTDKPTVRPTNCPTTPPVVNPLRTERWVAQAVTVGPSTVLNRVVATGPVSGTGSDVTVSNTLDRFNLPNIFRRVNVPHTGIAFPTINLRTCTASVDQNGLWTFAGGTGPFSRAFGSGVFNLDGQWTFPFRGSTCTLSLIRGNPLLQRLIQPTYSSIQVTGVGSARI